MFTLKVYIYMIVIHVAIVRAEWENVTSFSKSDFGDKQIVIFKCMNEIVSKGDIPFSSSIIMYILGK